MPPNPHPLVVHFPIALLTIAVICEIISRLSDRESIAATAFWNLIFGVIATVIAVATGLFAEDIVAKTGAAHETLESHETLGFASLSLFAVLFLWRVLRGGEFYRKFSSIFLAVLIAAWVALAITSFYGGELVYRHGVATPQPTLE